MQLIKLNAIDSTNRYLNDLAADIPLEDFAAVIAQSQTAGRGQRSAKWYSESGKNLIISILKKNLTTKIQRQFFLNMRVSLAVFKTLKNYNLPHLKLKWPNDILSGSKKISGILIDFSTQSNKIKQAIIGVGININQTHFANLPQATSMKLILDQSFDVQDIAKQLIENMVYYFENLDDQAVKSTYEELLFRANETSTFLDQNDIKFTGVILGVSDDGRLRVKTESCERLYDLKKISLMY